MRKEKAIVYKRRLRILARVLRQVPRRRFKIDKWFTGEFCTKTRPSEPQHNECKTAACALGWACTVPSFKKAGLHQASVGDEWRGGRALLPKYGRQDGFDAGQAFFGLDWNEAEDLFGEDNVNSPVAAAKRIEKLLKTKVW